MISKRSIRYPIEKIIIGGGSFVRIVLMSRRFEKIFLIGCF